MSSQKILIDYSEFKRLKEVEKKYHEQHSQTLGMNFLIVISLADEIPYRSSILTSTKI